MEYVQERIATLHDYGAAAPDVPVDETTVVVPLDLADYGTAAAERTFTALESVDPRRVLVALRTGPEHLPDVLDWVDSFDLRSTVLWCTAPAIEECLQEQGLASGTGKGRDLWLALGIAREDQFVVVHDADARTYDETFVPRLLFPLTRGYRFSKGYYARVEDGRLYGRLFRLLVTPLVDALSRRHDAPICSYLGAFRYALAGEFAVPGDVAGRLRPPPGWGLEIATLGDAFRVAGVEQTVQVDLGLYEHDHRPVDGSGGLGEMATEVADSLFTVLADQGIEIDYEEIAREYRTCARERIDQYSVDAAFNDLEYDPGEEREQVERYASALDKPDIDDRLPAWAETDLDASEIARRSAQDVDRVRSSSVTGKHR